MFIETPGSPAHGSQGGIEGDSVEVAQAASSGGEAIGQISAVQGTVFITHTDGSKTQGTDGAPIFQGDVIDTGDGAGVGITFADNSTFSLADNGSMVIDEMVYDPGTESGTSVLSVAEGVFTFVSGQIAKTDIDAMTIKTPVAVIGIRGTAGGGKAGAEGTNNTFSLFAGQDGVTGEMTITTQGGSQTMSIPNQTTQIASAFVPPTIPVTLPAAAVARFYAKAAAVAPTPIVIQSTGAGQAGDSATAGQTDGPAADGPAADGPAADGPTGDSAAALEDAEKAAEEAFEKVLAEGGDLDAAMNAAQGAATESGLRSVLAVNAEHFGSERAGDSVLTRIVDDVFLGVTGRIDYIGAGTGGGAGHDGVTDGFFTDGVDDFIDSGLGAVAESGFFDDFFGENQINPTEEFFDVFFEDPFQIFNKDVFEDTFNFGFEDFLFDVFSPLDFNDGILSFNENEFFLEEDETAFTTTNVFDDFVNGSTGNDTLIGGDGNTRFTMVQGTSLGGTDSVFGALGTDEVAFENLSNIALIFDGTSQLVSYANLTTSTISGSVSLNSVEQLFFDDGVDARVRLPTDLADASAGFFGYVLVGDGTSNTLNLADGTDLTSPYSGLGGAGTTVAASGGTQTFGALIFGGGGNDTITGSPGGDIIIAGGGDDRILSGPPPVEDSESLSGGNGVDTFVFNVSGTYQLSIKGGKFDGTDDATGNTITTGDTIQIGGTVSSAANTNTSPAVDLAQFGIIRGIEVLNIVDQNATFTAVNTFFQGLKSIIAPNLAGTVTLKGQGDLDLSGTVVDVGGFVDALALDTTNPNTSAITIKDFTDSVGRTITGVNGTNTIVGFGGGDTIDLIADTAVDQVFYTATSDTAATAGGVSGFDVITNFDSANEDFIIFTQDGTLGAFDDANLQFNTFAKNGSDLTQTGSGASVVFLSTTVTVGDLTTSGFAAVATAIGTITTATGTASNPEDDAIFIVNDGTDSGIYLYIATDTNNTVTGSAELTLLATVDAVLADGDVQFNSALPP